MSERQLIIAPSLLASDFGRLAEEIQKVQNAGADWLHVDVMDGSFVPNITIGPSIVKAMGRASRIPLDVHLMIDHPERYAKQFVDAGAAYVTIHLESPGVSGNDMLRKTLESIRQMGARAGLSLRPQTDMEALKPYLDSVDLILVMSVEPGFGGQAFLPEAVPKVRSLREHFSGDISVDGGISSQTGRQMRQAGANVLVAGTYIFQATSYRDAIDSLRAD